MAGTIDSLKFDVILDDKEFKRLVNEDISLAKKLNTSLSNVITIKKPREIISAQGVKNAKDMVDYLVQIENKIKNMPKGSYIVGDADQLNKTLQLVNANLDKMVAKQKEGAAATKLQNSSLMRTSSILQALTQITGVAFSVVGLRRFLSSLIDITGQFEVQRMALRSMLQDMDGADKIYEDLYRFSSESTYRFSELAKYAKQLAAFNIDQGNLLETTKMLGDVASGVGVSMDRLILAYGHVKSSGFLRGIQLRSFSQNGVPILDELAKMFSEVENRAVSLGEVFDKMTKREIPFEMVEEAFRRMTSEGGKFYQMQEVLAKTLAGQINILKGRWENMLAAIGQANSGVLKDTVSWMSDLVSSMDNVGRLINGLIAGFSAYQIALFASVAITESLAAAMNVGLVGAMKKVIKSFATMIATNPYAALAASVAVAAFAIHRWATNMSDAEKIQKELTKGVNDYKSALTVEQSELDRLYTKMRLAKEGTDDYNTARGELMSRFGPYIQELKAEGVQVDNLAAIYENLSLKIQDANKQRFLEATTQGITTKFGDATQEILENFQYTMKVVGDKLSASEQEILWQYVTGSVNREFIRLNTRLVEYLNRGGNNNPYTGGSYNETYSVEQLKAQYSSATDAYNKARDAAEDAFKVTKRLGGETKKNTEEAVYDVSSIVAGIEKIDKRIDEIRSKARSGKISQSEKEELEQLLKDRSADAKEYEDIMGVKYDKDQRGVAKRESAAEKAIHDKISDVKADITILEKFKSAYDKLEPVLGADAARAWVFNNMGHDVANLDDEFEKLIESLRKLGQEGNEAADSVEARLGLDAVNKLIKAKTAAEKAQKALEKYQATYRKWAGEDFNLGGTGFEYDIRKVFSDYNTKLSAVDEKYINAVKEAEEAHKGDAAAIADETRKLGELRDAEKEYIRAQSQESLNKLAESYLQDQYLLHGISLDHLGDKTIGQLKSLRKELVAVGNEARATVANFSYYESVLASWGMDIEAMTNDDIDALTDKLPESTIEMIRLMKAVKDSGLTFDELGEKIKSALQKGLDNLDTAEKKALGNLAKYAAKQVLSLADSFGRLGNAIGSADLSNAAKAIGAIGQNLQAAADGYKSTGSWIGAVAGGVVDIINQIVNAEADAVEKANQLRDAIREVGLEAQSARFDDMLSEGVDTLFGENFIKRVKDAISGIEDLRKGISGLEDARREAFEWMLKESKTVKGYTGRRGPKNYLSDEEMAERLSGFETPDVAGMKFRTDSSFWKGDTWKSLAEIASEFNMEIEDLNDNINPDLLDAIIEKYGELNQGAKDWLEGASEYAKEYAKAMEQIEEATKDIFDNLASDMTDKFIDNFLKMGNAVDDLSDTFADLGDTILRSFLQSYIIDEILGKYKDESNAALSEYAKGGMTPEDYAAWLDGFASNVQMESEKVAPAINSMIEAFKDRGLMNIDEDTSNSLGSGIKSITEDTANLLASYINAIRADVSYIRVMQEKGWESIGLLGASVPSLNEHLAQIAATNFDISQSNQSILSELRSVIGSPGTSGMVVRVEAY